MELCCHAGAAPHRMRRRGERSQPCANVIVLLHCRHCRVIWKWLFSPCGCTRLSAWMCVSAPSGAVVLISFRVSQQVWQEEEICLKQTGFSKTKRNASSLSLYITLLSFNIFFDSHGCQSCEIITICVCVCVSVCCMCLMVLRFRLYLRVRWLVVARVGVRCQGWIICVSPPKDRSTRVSVLKRDPVGRNCHRIRTGNNLSLQSTKTQQRCDELGRRGEGERFRWEHRWKAETSVRTLVRPSSPY